MFGGLALLSYQGQAEQYARTLEEAMLSKFYNFNVLEKDRAFGFKEGILINLNILFRTLLNQMKIIQIQITNIVLGILLNIQKIERLILCTH